MSPVGGRPESQQAAPGTGRPCLSTASAHTANRGETATDNSRLAAPESGVSFCFRGECGVPMNTHHSVFEKEGRNKGNGRRGVRLPHPSVLGAGCGPVRPEPVGAASPLQGWQRVGFKSLPPSRPGAVRDGREAREGKAGPSCREMPGRHPAAHGGPAARSPGTWARCCTAGSCRSPPRCAASYCPPGSSPSSGRRCPAGPRSPGTAWPPASWRCR